MNTANTNHRLQHTTSVEAIVTETVAMGELAVGSRCRIVAVDDHGATSRRLEAIGFVPGAEVLVRRRAPFGDPVEYEVRGSRFGLRRAEANWIRAVVA